MVMSEIIFKKNHFDINNLEMFYETYGIPWFRSNFFRSTKR